MPKRSGSFAVIVLFLFILVLPCIFYSSVISRPEDQYVFSPPAGMHLVWSDEFDGPGINLSNWRYETKASGWSQDWNKEYQDYTDNGTNGPNAFISNGNLVIRAIRANKRNDFNSYTSARLSTFKMHSWKYGLFAARIKMPYGNGIWPAFWMVGTNLKEEGWPTCGEIDIAEMKCGRINEEYGGGDSSVSGALHGPRNYGTQANQLFYTVTNGKLADDFHVYSINWTPVEIVWYFDGIEFLRVGTNDVKTWVADHHFYILLNLAVGGTWVQYPDRSNVFPQTMTVDWVRVYQ